MPHLKILDLVISVKILFPDKVILTGFRDLICIFRGERKQDMAGKENKTCSDQTTSLHLAAMLVFPRKP